MKLKSGSLRKMEKIIVLGRRREKIKKIVSKKGNVSQIEKSRSQSRWTFHSTEATYKKNFARVARWCWGW